jgi:hypothetical protein
MCPPTHRIMHPYTPVTETKVLGYVLQLNSTDGQTDGWLVGINLLGRGRQF